MKKYENGTMTSDTRFIRAGFLPVQERDENNVTTREYSWGLNYGGGIGGLLNLNQGGLDYSYLYDGKGNVSALIDNNQNVVATYRYDAFGNLMSKTGTLDQQFQFSTKRYDEKTGLSYYGYRYYSPAIGRWMTRDPIGELGGINLYGFVGNNPVNWLDPYGLFTPFADYGPDWAFQDGEVVVVDYSIPASEFFSIWAKEAGKCYLKTMDKIADTTESIPEKICPSGKPYPGFWRDIWNSLAPLRKLFKLP